MYEINDHKCQVASISPVVVIEVQSIWLCQQHVTQCSDHLVPIFRLSPSFPLSLPLECWVVHKRTDTFFALMYFLLSKFVKKCNDFHPHLSSSSFSFYWCTDIRENIAAAANHPILDFISSFFLLITSAQITRYLCRQTTTWALRTVFNHSKQSITLLRLFHPFPFFSAQSVLLSSLLLQCRCKLLVPSAAAAATAILPVCLCCVCASIPLSECALMNANIS